MSDNIAIENGWLVEVRNEHTCGTGKGGYYGAHEPGCGLVPIMTVEDALTRASERDAAVARAEVAEAALARVEALADEWEEGEDKTSLTHAAADLRRALSGDTPTEPTGDEPPAEPPWTCGNCGQKGNTNAGRCPRCNW